MPELGQILVLMGVRSAERWRWHTTLYLYPAAIARTTGPERCYDPEITLRLLCLSRTNRS